MKLACVSEDAVSARFRGDGGGAESRSKTWGVVLWSSLRRVDGVGSGISSRKQPKRPGLQGPLLTASGAHVSGSASRQQWSRA